MIHQINYDYPNSETPCKMHIYVPDDKSKSFPVIYVVNGHKPVFGTADQAFFDEVASYGTQFIWVEPELNPQDITTSEEIVDWIVKDLKPFMDREYPTLEDRHNTIIAGSQVGGLMAAYACLHYNAVFSRGVIISPNIEIMKQNILRKIKNDKFQGSRLYFSCSTHEKSSPMLNFINRVTPIMEQAMLEIGFRTYLYEREDESDLLDELDIWLPYLYGKDRLSF